MDVKDKLREAVLGQIKASVNLEHSAEAHHKAVNEKLAADKQLVRTIVNTGGAPVIHNGHRYFIDDAEILLIEPQTDRVV